ncbi:MAG: xanthine dehydrogenase family protein subunit M [Rhodobacteraceae bacterium]|nr:xanthine dehydrogenase family protein subunit M [Paracoccaceae bacterium]MBR9823760.1 xanthine dehydrogenase family protein subunit M [Paracoccaceae bacterium]
MTVLRYSRAADLAEAVSAGQEARLLGGGTNLIDLMRKGVERPQHLLDVSRLPAGIDETEDGGLLIGGALSNAALAADPRIRAHYPMLSRAVLAGASAQIRNMATVAGNLMQRTRCPYFADVAGASCNRRVPGSGCDAQGGVSRYTAVLGTSKSCIAAHPSDMAVALVALDAVVCLEGPAGPRRLAITDFHLLPGDSPEKETALAPGEVISGVVLPPSSLAARSAYRKVRDRASYAFALVSVAAGLRLEAGRIAEARIALGGVGTVPWRAARAEALLIGAEPTPELFARAADAELAEAETQPATAFKPELARRTLRAVLTTLAEDAA